MKESHRQRLIHSYINRSLFQNFNSIVAVTFLTGEQMQGKICNQNNLTITITSGTNSIREIPWTAIKYIEWVDEGNSDASK